MTAFARQTIETELGMLTWELKSVNHRFSEASLRLPEELRPHESIIRNKISKVVKRGKVDAILRYQGPALQEKGTSVDINAINALTAASNEIISILPNANPLSTIDILKWPGVLKSPEIDNDKLVNAAMELLDITLNELLETRTREGSKLKRLIEERCNAMAIEVVTVQKRIPAVIENLRTRLKDKLELWKTELDETRLEQEIVLFLNKSDVAEEIDRLITHVDEVKRVLEQRKPVGRRLDFLMQELNREANTLGSKSNDTEMTRASVELKVLIEQMREQVQNIE
ncbi:MAG: YicC family protein [Gammaproteobacteria bacterium]|nr:YicC family protein [Gammaproteobacteria bacterium]